MIKPNNIFPQSIWRREKPHSQLTPPPSLSPPSLPKYSVSNEIPFSPFHGGRSLGWPLGGYELLHQSSFPDVKRGETPLFTLSRQGTRTSVWVEVDRVEGEGLMVWALCSDVDKGKMGGGRAEKMFPQWDIFHKPRGRWRAVMGPLYKDQR